MLVVPEDISKSQLLAMARVLKHLPTAVSLWSPEDVAAFLRSKGQMEAAQRVEKSVRLHSFDEVDGPRVLRYGMKGLQGVLDLFLCVCFHCFIYLLVHDFWGSYRQLQKK